MSSVPPPLSYATPSDPERNPFWTGLRIAAIVWAATILVRHGVYWTTIAVPSQNSLATLSLALAEAATLVAMAVVAVTSPVPTAARVRTLAILGATMIALSCVGLLVDLSGRPLSPLPTFVARLIWMAATRLQVQAIPIALIIAALVLPRRTMR